MDLYEGLITRRSIRNYTGEKVPDDQIIKIIKAGMYAPSARNTRPWHFIIVDDREQLRKIMEFHPYAKMLAGASHAIVVCGDSETENGPGYYKLDCSAATQNILLAAHSMGLGAVWLGIEPRTERINAIKTIFSLPDNIQPLSVVSVGVPVKTPENIPERFEPSKIRKNRW